MKQAVWLIFIIPLSAMGCEWSNSDSVRVDADTEVFYQFHPASPLVGEFFSANLRICHSGKFVSPAHISVDATMPAHGHGMNYRPTVAIAGPNEFSVQGLLLHMLGLWRFEIRFKLFGERRQAIFDHTLQ